MNIEAVKSYRNVRTSCSSFSDTSAVRSKCCNSTLNPGRDGIMVKCGKNPVWTPVCVQFRSSLASRHHGGSDLCTEELFNQHASSLPPRQLTALPSYYVFCHNPWILANKNWFLWWAHWSWFSMKLSKYIAFVCYSGSQITKNNRLITPGKQ